MSDFDKEAEREKLREKYERDQAERQATQRMSDLLLKGATMTNSHCGTCGDPLFQQDGTAFCPSCHGNPDAVSGTELEAQPADEAAADASNGEPRDNDSTRRSGAVSPGRDDEADATGTSGSATQRPSDAARQTGEGETPATDDAATSDDATDDRREKRAASSPKRDATSPSPQRSDRVSNHTSDRDQGSNHTSDRDQGPRAAAVDHSDARDSLQQALETFAAEAAATDDPRYAKECLEAAREASETLNTLR